MYRQTLLFILVFLLLVPIGSYKEPQNKVVVASSVRTPPSYFFDFGGARTPVERGWTQVKDTDRYNRSRGYGFLSNVTSFYVTRRQVPEIRPFVLPRSWVYNTYANEMTVDGVRSTKSVLFRVDLPNGTYRVRIWIGDLQRAVYSMNISVNGKWVVEKAAAFHIASRSVYLQPFNYGFRVCYSTDVSVEDGYLLVNVTGNDTTYWSRLEEERRRDPPYSYLAWMSQGIKKYSSGSGPWRYIGGPFTNASVMGIEVYPRPNMPVEKVGKRLVISPTVSSSHIISAVSCFNAGDLVSAFESWNSSLPENLSGVNLIARAQVGLYLAGSLKLDRELDILSKVEADLSRALREQPRNTGIKELLEDTRKMRSGLGYYITRTEYGKNHFQECDKAISLLWTIHPNEPLYPKAMLWCSRALFS
ncbi:MAG: hypothetical protein J7L88_02500, partial [Thermoplasmata archaeon]|nr:hypothetical protein [Thermoplasmata archaeon]